METTKPATPRLRTVLIWAAAILLALTILLAMVCIPYFREVPETPTEPPAPPTEAPTEPPTQEPTLPPPPPNPYGDLDFQYDGPFLKLIDGDSIPGIDVSSWQYDIDWEKVAATGAEFAIIRIGYRGSETGKLNVDKYALQNLQGAAAAGLDIGVYFFSQALTPSEAEEEAYFVLDMIKDHNITMPVVFDWERIRGEQSRSNEPNRRDLTDCAKAFLETIEFAGYNAMVYFNPHQSRNLLYLEELTDYDFWLASYTDRMDFPYKVNMWQYTDQGQLPGIDTYCDLNVYFPEYG